MAWITGRHGIESALNRGASGRLFIVRDPRNNDFAETARKKGIPVVWTEHRDLRTRCGSTKVRGAAFQQEAPQSRREENDTSLGSFLSANRNLSHSLVLILDHVTDPHNLGAILRSADMFKVDLVVIPERRSVTVTDTVSRTSAGASAYVPIAVERNLARSVELLKDAGYWVFAADMDGLSSYDVSFTEKTTLIVGSEGKGLSSLLRKKCDKLIGIRTGGHLDSLNVSVSAALLLYEYRRNFTIG